MFLVHTKNCMLGKFMGLSNQASFNIVSQSQQTIYLIIEEGHFEDWCFLKCRTFVGENLDILLVFIT